MSLKKVILTSAIIIIPIVLCIVLCIILNKNKPKNNQENYPPVGDVTNFYIG
jgi:hypothetical protein